MKKWKSSKKGLSKIYFIAAFALFFIFALTGCKDNGKGQSPSNSKKLVIGTSPVTFHTVDAIVPLMAEKGYDVEVKAFNDFVMPNIALGEKSIHCNIFQHQPYLDSYNNRNNTDFQLRFRTTIALVELLSNKYDSIEKLPQNGKIGVFQDASNQDRVLKMLRAEGLITLKEKPEGQLYTLLDIDENKKNFKFFTQDIGNLPNSIDDFDGIFSAMATMNLAKKSAKYSLLKEELNDYSKQYTVGIVVRKEDVNAEWIKDLAEAYKNPEAQKKIDERVKGFTLLSEDVNK